MTYPDTIKTILANQTPEELTAKLPGENHVKECSELTTELIARAARGNPMFQIALEAWELDVYWLLRDALAERIPARPYSALRDLTGEDLADAVDRYRLEMKEEP